MTLMKSLLLGSAAGVVAVASAQAADLPTRKGPVAVEYVRVCSITVAGAPVVGWVLPGSDTCFKISGYVTGQVEAGNLKTGYSMNYVTNTVIASGYRPVRTSRRRQWLPRAAFRWLCVQHGAMPAPRTSPAPTAAKAVTASAMSTRANLTLDAVSNTAYGPLVGHIEYQFNYGCGLRQRQRAAPTAASTGLTSPGRV